ncbi:hypothetical protein QO003_000041 [Arthrobacter silviterrae]|uniref:Uncharacterized protein n=1 Tax=Arthrobacter silviterrae TaxID=2026658 RepID=A0ABX0D8E5_9MICC|nr:hypothetical protein [Arthrobacter silviterrae]MDQ0275738.1 hypothetical protein [Arthrobacter silviterrae]NGN83164.1 hypothetical protein [Arthrobacter silviterrae]
MTEIVLSIHFEKFRFSNSRRYDTIELERQHAWQLGELPYGTTVRLDVGGLPPIPDNLGWHRYGLEYIVDATDVTTALQWCSMLDQHLDAIAGHAIESWGA